MTDVLAFTLFAFTFWLGGYLIVRNPARLAMHLAGWGLIAYAGALALSNIAARAESPLLSLVQGGLSVAPAVLWIVTFGQLLRRGPEEALPRRPVRLLVIGALFFALSLGLLLSGLLPQFWALTLIGIDMGLLGVALVKLDAFDEGESFWPDMPRSALASGLAALAFGGLVAVAAQINGGWTFPFRLLMFGVIALAIDVQLFAPRLQAWLDRLVLSHPVQQSRAELRAVSEVLPRANDAIDPNSLDAAEFARLTRRALSHMTDLPKLAISPLTQLPAVDHHLAEHGMPDTPLDRAVALRAILTIHIAKLKPDASDFGTSDAWRHYNALYFPYVAGLKPYSVRAGTNGQAPLEQQALEWFQSSVPERTLHNWQNAAAKMIASELRIPPVVGRRMG
jgi:hypothetical protein